MQSKSPAKALKGYLRKRTLNEVVRVEEQPERSSCPVMAGRFYRAITGWLDRV
jgi:hypothetical protein